MSAMLWSRNLVWWHWAILGAVFGLLGPVAGASKAAMDGSQVPLSYLLADFPTMSIVLLSCGASVAIFIVFGLALGRFRLAAL